MIHHSKPQSSVLSTHDSASSKHLFQEICCKLLRAGHKVRFRAPGKSMQPAICDGDILIVEPVEPAAVKIGDIILYRAEENIVAHRVLDLKKSNVQSPGPHASHDRVTHQPIEGASSAGYYPVPGTHRSFTLRGDAASACDDHVTAEQVLGRVVSIEKNGRCINPYSLKQKIQCLVRKWIRRIKVLVLE